MRAKIVLCCSAWIATSVLACGQILTGSDDAELPPRAQQDAASLDGSGAPDGRAAAPDAAADSDGAVDAMSWDAAIDSPPEAGDCGLPGASCTTSSDCCTARCAHGGFCVSTGCFIAGEACDVLGGTRRCCRGYQCNYDGGCGPK